MPRSVHRTHPERVGGAVHEVEHQGSEADLVKGGDGGAGCVQEPDLADTHPVHDVVLVEEALVVRHQGDVQAVGVPGRLGDVGELEEVTVGMITLLATRTRRAKLRRSSRAVAVISSVTYGS